ncbi:MAG: hypothetical protein R3A44_38965 [Caldilineaceae bacterium]
MDCAIEEWNKSISNGAIAQTVQLATKALLTYADEFVLEPFSV